tara:strand:+ start:1109 stop:1543 length:435 start_codon:yes stop_codon:yes gene_type:complete
MLMEATEYAAHHANQLLGRALHRLFHCRSMIRYGHWLPTFDSGLKHATLVQLPVFAPILITEVNFHSCDFRIPLSQRLFDFGIQMGCPSLRANTMGVCVYLNFHVLFRLWKTMMRNDSAPSRLHQSPAIDSGLEHGVSSNGISC